MITYVIGDEEYDIVIDRKQLIGAPFQLLFPESDNPPRKYRSLIEERLVDGNKIFEEEGIYDGDKLTAIF